MSDGLSKEEIDQWFNDSVAHAVICGGSLQGEIYERDKRIGILIAEVRRLQGRLERKDEWLDFMFNEVKEFSETILSQLQSAREKSVEKELENPCKHGNYPGCILCWDEK